MPDKNHNNEPFDLILKQAFTDFNENEIKELPANSELEGKFAVSENHKKLMEELITKGKYKSKKNQSGKKRKHILIKIIVSCLLVFLCILIVSAVVFDMNDIWDALSGSKAAFIKFLGKGRIQIDEYHEF